MAVSAGSLTDLVGLIIPAADLSALAVQSATLNGTPFVNATVATMQVTTTADLGPGPTLPSQSLHIVSVDNTANTIRLKVFTGTTEVATFTYVAIGYAADHLLLSFGIGESSGTVATQYAAHIDFNSVMAVLSLAQVPASSTIDFSATEAFTAAPCFVAGTRIATEMGECAVEDLRPGDMVRTPGSAARPVVWTGSRRVWCRNHIRGADVWPVRIRAGAFTPGRPHRDLLLSPDHAVAVENPARLGGTILIPARYLLNGATILQEPVDSITYHHIELATHDVLLAEGLPCESYLDTGNRSAFANASDSVIGLPGPAAEAIWARDSCAPLVMGGSILAAIRRRLLDRAVASGSQLARDPGLVVLADGREVSPGAYPLAWQIHVPHSRELRLVSRSFVPGHTTAEPTDMRRLGVAVAALRFDGAAADARLGQGWHAQEPGWRWTDGDARLDVRGIGRVEFSIVSTGSYWAETAPGLPPGVSRAVGRTAA